MVRREYQIRIEHAGDIDVTCFTSRAKATRAYRAILRQGLPGSLFLDNHIELVEVLQQHEL